MKTQLANPLKKFEKLIRYISAKPYDVYLNNNEIGKRKTLGIGYELNTSEFDTGIDTKELIEFLKLLPENAKFAADLDYGGCYYAEDMPSLKMIVFWPKEEQ